MKFSAIRLRYQIARPECDIESQSNVQDIFRFSDGYACESTDDGWVRIRHVESGDESMVPASAVMASKPVKQQQQVQPAPQQTAGAQQAPKHQYGKHGGKR